jgi:hypothetical protein
MVKEDFERVHLLDRIYLREDELFILDEINRSERVKKSKFVNYDGRREKRPRYLERRSIIQSFIRTGRSMSGRKTGSKHSFSIRNVR